MYCPAQQSTDYDKGKHRDLMWFRNAKFGMFIHWGLYSELGGRWKGHDYFGSGEWIMHQAKIPAKEYALIAKRFNPVDFNASQWASIAKESGVRYMVITAKHHEGFSMFDSKVSDFNIVDATPFKQDPMKALSEACREVGIEFGFYYSQFLDWHEANGGGNDWDFREKDKDYHKYYNTKSIPQLKELLSNYGRLGLVWFDMPGGLTKEQTRQMVENLHRLQPDCLFSSRVGHGLGDYRDFGDSEVPPVPIIEAWEAIFTDNNTWGYISRDKNFKSSKDIIQLLAQVASKGGNLMLNVSPDGEGNFPPYQIKNLLKTGQWLQDNGESIYGTTYGLIPPQPWGVTTSKPGKLFLHIFRRPENGELFVPFVKGSIKEITLLGTHKKLNFKKDNDGIIIQLPDKLPDDRNTVVEVNYIGQQPDHAFDHAQTISKHFSKINIPVIQAAYHGVAENKSITSSHYFGDWKHDNCALNMKDTTDKIEFDLNIRQPGDYRIILKYACSPASAGQEGVIKLANQNLYFRTLETGEYNSNKPLMFIDHSIGLVTISEEGNYKLIISAAEPVAQELFWLKELVIQPVQG